MLERVTKYEDLIGMDKLVEFSRNRINRGTFPTITAYHGEEGTGKTSLMFLNAMALTCTGIIKPCGECSCCIEAQANLIGKGADTQNIKVLRMSIEGGKQAAQESLEHLNTSFTTNGIKVVIYEECHRMKDDAQDVLLSPIEFLPKGVFVMFATTDILSINKALLSRMLQLQVNKPNRKDLIRLLKRHTNKKGIEVQGGDAVFELIASWADNKQRASLQILEAIGEDGSLDYESVRDFVQFLEVKKVIPIISNLNASLLIGMSAILDLPLDKNSHSQFLELLIEIVKLKRSGRANKLSQEDTKLLREATNEIDLERIVEFLYDIASVKELTRQALVSAFLKGHPGRGNFVTHSDETLQSELAIQSANQTDFKPEQRPKKVMSIEEIMSQGKLVN